MDETIPHWARELSDDDWHFVKRFLVASGSLKELAAQYHISYPTVRLRLDRLIEKVKLFDEDKPSSPFRAKIRALVIDGKLDIATAKTIIKTHEKTIQKGN